MSPYFFIWEMKYTVSDLTVDGTYNLKLNKIVNFFSWTGVISQLAFEVPLSLV